MVDCICLTSCSVPSSGLTDWLLDASMYISCSELPVSGFLIHFLFIHSIFIECLLIVWVCERCSVYNGEQKGHGSHFLGP